MKSKHVQYRSALHYDADDLSLEDALVSTSANGQLRRAKGLKMAYNTPEYRKGEATEKVLRELFETFIDGVKEVRVAPKGSAADDDWKIDLVVYTTTKAYPIQVKSSEAAADAALEANPDVPVVWIAVTSGKERYQLLKEMVEYLQLVELTPTVVPEVNCALKLYNKYIEQGLYTIPKMVYDSLYPLERRTLEMLLLVKKTKGGDYQLLPLK